MKKYLLSLCLLIGAISAENSVAQTVLFSENFSSGTLPAGWSNDSMGMPAANSWIFDNQYGRIITGAAFDTTFAMFDSDEGSVNDSIDELASLTTPPINLAAAGSSLSLEFDEQYRPLTGATGSTRLIEMSVDNGVTWDTVVFGNTGVGYPNPAAHSSFDISSALGSLSVKIRFTYSGSWDWWWAIDNVSIVTQPVNVDAINPESDLQVLPNPATSNLNVSFTNKNAELVILKMYNLNGKLVYSENLMPTVGKINRTIDLSKFSKGIYSLQLFSKAGIVNKKIVIE